MARAPFQPSIARRGQPYYDEVIEVHPRRENACAAAVREAVGSKPPPPIAVAFNRVPLRWRSGDARPRTRGKPR